MSKGRGIILLDSGDIAWFGCYDCGQEMKAKTSTRRWNPQQKCWTLDKRELYTAWQVLKKHHPEAQVVDSDGVKQPDPQAPRTQRSWWEEEFNRKIRDRQQREQARSSGRFASGAATWAEQMFASVPAELHSDVFKALLHVLHPDKNGDTEACRVLLEAREKRRGAA